MPIKAKALFRCKNVSHHQFKEKPGLLQGAFSNAPTAHHPLEGQLFVEQLKQTIKVEAHGQNKAGGEDRQGQKIKGDAVRHQENIKPDLRIKQTSRHAGG